MGGAAEPLPPAPCAVHLRMPHEAERIGMSGAAMLLHRCLAYRRHGQCETARRATADTLARLT